MVFKCEGCGATAATEKEVKHKEGEAAEKQKVVKTCAQSGTFPHTGKTT
jgi:hypothetical protein